jgi:hypothetical protein
MGSIQRNELRPRKTSSGGVDLTEWQGSSPAPEPSGGTRRAHLLFALCTFLLATAARVVYLIVGWPLAVLQVRSWATEIVA